MASLQYITDTVELVWNPLNQAEIGNANANDIKRWIGLTSDAILALERINTSEEEIVESLMNHLVIIKDELENHLKSDIVIVNMRQVNNTVKPLHDALHHAEGVGIENIKRSVDFTIETMDTLKSLMIAHVLSSPQKRAAQSLMVHLLSIECKLDNCRKIGGDLQYDDQVLQERIR